MVLVNAGQIIAIYAIILSLYSRDLTSFYQNNIQLLQPLNIIREIFHPLPRRDTFSKHIPRWNEIMEVLNFQRLTSQDLGYF
jgi:hypothetical protein